MRRLGRASQTGDILLFSTVGGFSSLIEQFTDSLWSHAAFIWNMEDIDRVILLESVETFGVRAIALSNRIDGDRRRHNRTPVT